MEMQRLKRKGAKYAEVRTEMGLKSGLCPKCDSGNVRFRVKLRGKTATNRLELNTMVSVALDTYVCADCGYVERYIANPKRLRYIAEHWKRVDKQENNG